MQTLWVDNDFLNYCCRTDCLEEVIRKVPYTLRTTELVLHEARAGGAVLQSAIDAMQAGAIAVHPLGTPPLDHALSGSGALSPADESLLLCAKHLGGEVLTNDRALQRRCARDKVRCMPFADFLNKAASSGWLDTSTIEKLRAVSGL